MVVLVVLVLFDHDDGWELLDLERSLKVLVDFDVVEGGEAPQGFRHSVVLAVVCPLFFALATPIGAKH